MFKRKSEYGSNKSYFAKILKAKNVFDVCEHDIKPILLQDDDDKDAFSKLLKEWVIKDRLAQEIIVSRIEKGPVHYIPSCKTAFDVWIKLCSSEVSLHMIQQNFFGYYSYEGRGISFNVSRLMELVNQMKQLGENISEKILMSLPSERSHFTSAWESTQSDKQNLNELLSRLLIEEERMTRKEENANEIFAVVSKNVLNLKCYSCGKLEHVQKE